MALNTTMHNRQGHLKVFDFEFCAIQRTTYIVLTIELTSCQNSNWCVWAENWLKIEIWCLKWSLRRTKLACGQF